ncbi:Coenzyme F420 hydrogenase/dehydrogenase, beta subunit C-terminal domain [Desulfurobacterium sp.]|uniref:Coenzyme F420 hydrogenase/dehydrogenase, beta subunit C-terminal domain n=1 Tax=Desulfurobacterium sp. TaxID=2004706 RepID=UPI00261D6697|nr:Coenzyme F420 hydrogenase/dehydrogenase, beta subunit C-terminal domain [Desulfurobacterium sp.]
MLGLNRQFILGKFTKAFLLRAGKNATPKDNLRILLESAFDKGLIDSVIGTTIKEKNGTSVTTPVFIKSKEELKGNEQFFFVHGGQNSILKEITQKYSFEKVAVVGHSCVLDGINKMQYFGIGYNFTALKFALKIGIFCIGAASMEGIKCLLKEKGDSSGRINEIFINRSKIYIKSSKLFAFSPEEYYFYVNEGCKVCMNVSSRGSDVTFVPCLDNDYSLCFVRSKRAEKLFEDVPFEVKEAGEEEISRVENMAKEILKKNIETTLERAELGIPSNKWDRNRYGRFSALWNNIYAEDIEEEVF